MLDIQLVRDSLNTALANRDELVTDFYHALFEIAPTVRGMFPDDLQAQSKKLGQTLVMAVNGLENLAELEGPLKSLGAKHAEFGALPEHYPVVGDALITTLKAALGDEWTESHEASWRTVLDAVSDTMMAGVARAAASGGAQAGLALAAAVDAPGRTPPR